MGSVQYLSSGLDVTLHVESMQPERGPSEQESNRRAQCEGVEGREPDELVGWVRGTVGNPPVRANGRLWGLTDNRRAER